MANAKASTWDYDRLIRLQRAIRALHSAGMYNVAKLLSASAFSLEIKARNRELIALGPGLDSALSAVIDNLAGTDVNSAVIDALRRGQDAVKGNRTIPRNEIPEIRVCRDCGEMFLGYTPYRCPSCGARRLTFREFPPVYWLEPLHPAEVLEALQTAPDELDALGRGLTEDQLTWVPSPGQWSIRDVLAHLLAVQGVLAARIQRMTTEENPRLAGVTGWTMGDRGLTAAQILTGYRASRGETVARLKELKFEEWWRTGEHEEFGRVTILQQTSYFAKHERYHLPRAEATRRLIEAKRG